MPDAKSPISSFKALSIDGGGIKGLYSALLLAHLEEEYGCHIADRFDLLSGTSTGGLIALALSLKVPAREVANFYIEKKDLIFPQQGGFRGAWRQIVGPGKYEQNGLRRALLDVFGSRKLKDSQTLLCIPTFDLTGDRPWIFKYDHDGLTGRDNETAYVDVALATSAAPTYFPVVEIANHDGHRFIDGGVYANNPSVIALTEAFTYFVGPDRPYGHLDLLSVPSVEQYHGQRPNRKNALSAVDWGAALLRPFMTGQAHITNYSLEQFSKHELLPVTYYRMRQPSKMSPEHARHIGLDKADDESVRLLTAFGKAEGINQCRDDAVAAFFDTPKTFRTQ